MIGRHLRTTFRSIRRQRVLSFITIASLAVGLAGAVLLLLYVADELSFDRVHRGGKSVYAIMNRFYARDGGLDSRGSSLPGAIGEPLRAFFPEIEEVVRFSQDRGVLRAGDVLFTEPITFTDPGIFRTFTLPLASGNPETALARRASIVLTASVAAKLFGRSDPVGRTVGLGFGTSERRDLVVTAVAEDPPRNSSVRFRALVRIEELDWSRSPEMMSSLGDFSIPTYVKLRPGASPRGVQDRMDEFIRRTYAAEFERWGAGASPERWLPIGFELEPLRKVHFDPDHAGGVDRSGLLLLTAIALAVLLVAGINFVNLSIGRSSVRVGEVGLRKVIGADRPRLLVQFGTESSILVGLAFAASLALAAAVLPSFNRLAGKALTTADFFRPANVAGLAVLLVVVAAAAGAYPALVLSSVRPVEAFKGRMGWGGRRVLTKGLLVLQFALSIMLVVSTLVLGKQIRFLIAKDPGYAWDGLITMMLPLVRAEENQPLVDRFRSECRDLSGVVGVTASNIMFGRNFSQGVLDHQGRRLMFGQYRVDPEFVRTLGLRIAAGRDFSPDPRADQDAAVVNRQFCRELGIADPVGRLVGEFADGDDAKYPNRLRIIGLMEDFQGQSFKEPAEAALLMRQPGWRMWVMYARVRTAGVAATLRGLEAAWRAVLPDMPFEYSFVQDDLARQYASEARWGAIVAWASGFAVAIAALGVFGLTLLSVRRRFREIGIRKVLGAGTARLLTLVGREFLVLVAVANAAAWPVGYAIMRRVLNGYASRIPLGPGPFALAAALSLAAAGVTVGALAWRAALSDPVKTIRYE